MSRGPRMRRGARAIRVASLIAVWLGIGCSGKRSEPAPGQEVRIPDRHDAAESADAAPATAPADVGPAAARADVPPRTDEERPDPFASLFPERYMPGETLPERMRRRIRFHLRGQSRAPIALHHVIDIPRPDGGREVFAIYEYSLYEECMLRYPTPKEGRAHCLGELVSVTDPSTYEHREGGPAFKSKKVRINGACVVIGAVRARFGPADPALPGSHTDTGGALIVRSTKLADSLCKADDYNRVFVADLDGDQELEMYLDLTTVQEKLGNVRLMTGSWPGINTVVRQHLYLLSGAELGPALSLYSDSPFEWFTELRDIDGDGHLDVIQTDACRDQEKLGDPSWPICSEQGPEKHVYIYDPKQDAWLPSHAPALAPADGARPRPEGEEAAPP